MPFSTELAQTPATSSVAQDPCPPDMGQSAIGSVDGGKYFFKGRFAGSSFQSCPFTCHRRTKREAFPLGVRYAPASFGCGGRSGAGPVTAEWAVVPTSMWRVGSREARCGILKPGLGLCLLHMLKHQTCLLSLLSTLTLPEHTIF